MLTSQRGVSVQIELDITWSRTVGRIPAGQTLGGVTMQTSLPRTRRLTVLLIVLGLAIGVSASTAAAAAVDRVDGPFETVVPVAYANNPAGVELMFAECDFVQRVERPDGSAVETQSCHLTGPFFDFPGTPPTQAFNNSAGPCIWFSDYFSLTTDESVWASSVRLTVTPSGNVNVTTMYSAERLDCD